jgi:hypothetical protein
MPHHAHSIDRWDDVTGSNLYEHLAGVNDLLLARATFAAAVKRWPGAKITLRRGALIIAKTWRRIIEPARRPSSGWSASPTIGGGFVPRRLKMLGKARVAAVLMIPTALSAQVGGAGVSGAAVRGAVVRGIPTPSDLGASSTSYYRSVQKHNTAPKKPRRRQ